MAAARLSAAALKPTLLARKGTALPAMRVEAVARGGRDDLDALARSQDDLGWNDHGTPEPRSTAAAPHRAAFTLRIDPERHLKLRLACTVRNASAQLLVTEALDRFLDEIPQLDALANQIARTSGKA